MNHPFKIVWLSADPEAETGEVRPTADPAADEQQRVDLAAVEAMERARLRKAAEEAGYGEGMSRARAEALDAIQASLGPAVAKLEETIERLNRDWSVGREAMTRSAVAIGACLAEALVGAPAIFDRSALANRILEEAKGETAYGGMVLICRANPETLREIARTLPPSVTTVEDISMKRGGFIVELKGSEGGGVVNCWDASVERMEQVIRGLRFNG